MVGKSSSLIANVYNVSAYQWNAGSALSNSGEAIVLKDNFGFVVDSVYYLPTLPWDTMANGRGPTLQLCDPNANNLLPQNWRHAVEYKGKTGAGDSLFASPLEGCFYLPVAAFTASDSTISIGQSVVFSDASTGDITSWFWEFERGIPESFNGQVPPPIQYNIMGAYDVTLTVTNYAGQNKKYKPGFIQVGPAGIKDPGTDNSVRISPNPVKHDNFSIHFPSAAEYHVAVLTSSGMPFLQAQTSSASILLECSLWSRGFYFIKTTNLQTGKTDTQKLIVQ
jgi:PKD repeat protein